MSGPVLRLVEHVITRVVTRVITCVAKYTACLSVFVLAGCFLIPEDGETESFELPEPPKITSAVTYPVSRMEIVEAVEGSVRVTPIREVSLYFGVGGRVRTINVAPSQQVEEGEVLAQLEIEDLEHSLALTRLDYRIAQTNYRRMDAQDLAPIDLEIQQLQLQKQRLAVDYLEQKVAAATIAAPFAGVIKRVQIRMSDLVREYDPVLVISDPTDLEMQMAIDQTTFLDIDSTAEAEIRLDADTWAVAKIVQTTHQNPRLDASLSREEYIVHLEFIDEGPALRLSDRMPGRIVLQRHENALVIPSAALREFGGRTYVRVLTDGVRREVDVKTGIHTGTRVEIIDGLDEGELVIGK